MRLRTGNIGVISVEGAETVHKVALDDCHEIEA
jgi:hypothetical protein